MYRKNVPLPNREHIQVHGWHHVPLGNIKDISFKIRNKLRVSILSQHLHPNHLDGKLFCLLRIPQKKVINLRLFADNSFSDQP